MSEKRIIILFDSDIWKVRKMGREFAAQIGFNEVEAGEIEIAIAELATNLIKHRALHGELIFTTLVEANRVGLEIRAEDKGPGIKNIEQALQDGFSTRGTLGIGLAGVKRLMDEFTIESEMGKGTLITVRKWLKKDFSPRINFAVLERPLPGEEVSGDTAFIKQEPSFSIFGVMDALGHGSEAYETSLLALLILKESYRDGLKRIIEKCHDGLRHSRGVAMALVRIDFTRKVLEHISIGNVETRIYGSRESIRPFCYNGTLGMRMETYKVTEYPYTPGSTIIMFSDGISGKFDLSPGQLGQSPHEIAKFIFENFIRENDDAIVLVGK